jgi:hypothetical protein
LNLTLNHINSGNEIYFFKYGSVMNKLLKISILIYFCCVACIDEIVTPNGSCINCLSRSDTTAFIYIHLSTSETQPAVPVVIYREKYNPNKLMVVEKKDTAATDTYRLLVSLGHYYSVSAEYIEGGDTILAIDGGVFDIEKVNCDNPCYQTVGGIYDVKKRF